MSAHEVGIWPISTTTRRSRSTGPVISPTCLSTSVIRRSRFLSTHVAAAISAGVAFAFSKSSAALSSEMPSAGSPQPNALASHQAGRARLGVLPNARAALARECRTPVELPRESEREMGVPNQGLKRNAIGYASSVVIGVASTAPGYSLAAVLGVIVAIG